MHRPLLLTAAMIAAGAATAFAQPAPAPRWQLALTGGAGLIGVQNRTLTSPSAPDERGLTGVNSLFADRPAYHGQLGLELDRQIQPMLSIRVGVLGLHSVAHESEEVLPPLEYTGIAATNIQRTMTATLIAPTVGLALHHRIEQVDLSLGGNLALGVSKFDLRTVTNYGFEWFDGSSHQPWRVGLGGIGSAAMVYSLTNRLGLRVGAEYRLFTARRPSPSTEARFHSSSVWTGPARYELNLDPSGAALTAGLALRF